MKMFQWWIVWVLACGLACHVIVDMNRRAEIGYALDEINEKLVDLDQEVSVNIDLIRTNTDLIVGHSKTLVDVRTELDLALPAMEKTAEHVKVLIGGVKNHKEAIEKIQKALSIIDQRTTGKGRFHTHP